MNSGVVDGGGLGAYIVVPQGMGFIPHGQDKTKKS